MLWNILRERSRAKAVESLTVVGTLPGPGLDHFTALASQAFAAPIALLTLLYDDQLWVEAGTGLNLRCLPREDSFCNHAVDRDDLLEVCDARSDALFKRLPGVTGSPFIRYYIGAPLKLANGIEFGALCVSDTKPRPPASRDQRAYLVGLARQATQALERNAQARGSQAA